MRAPRGIGQRYLDRLDRVKKGSRPFASPFLVRSEDTFRWAGENGFHLMTLPYLYREAHMLPGFIKTYRYGLAKDA